MNGSMTMIGFGMAPADDWARQTIDSRLTMLAKAGFPIDDRKAGMFKGKAGLAEFAVAPTCSTMLAIDAAQAACRDAALRFDDFSPDKIGLVLCGGSSVDRLYPATACWVQHALGIAGGTASACDILSACASFGQALHHANALMRVYNIEYAVLTFGETIFSRVANYNGPQDMSWCLWGDGGGAVVLRYDPEGSPSRGLRVSHSISDGEFAHYTCSAGLGCSALPGEPRNPSMGEYGRNIQEYLLRHMPNLVRDAFAASGCAQIDYYLPHAANRHTGRTIGELLGLRAEQVLSEIETWGNTSSASVPISLAHHAGLGTFKPGDVLAINTYGGGMVATCAIYVWPD